MPRKSGPCNQGLTACVDPSTPESPWQAVRRRQPPRQPQQTQQISPDSFPSHTVRSRHNLFLVHAIRGQGDSPREPRMSFLARDLTRRPGVSVSEVAHPRFVRYASYPDFGRPGSGPFRPLMGFPQPRGANFETGLASRRSSPARPITDLSMTRIELRTRFVPSRGRSPR